MDEDNLAQNLRSSIHTMIQAKRDEHKRHAIGQSKDGNIDARIERDNYIGACREILNLINSQ